MLSPFFRLCLAIVCICKRTANNRKHCHSHCIASTEHNERSDWTVEWIEHFSRRIVKWIRSCWNQSTNKFSVEINIQSLPEIAQTDTKWALTKPAEIRRTWLFRFTTSLCCFFRCWSSQHTPTRAQMNVVLYMYFDPSRCDAKWYISQFITQALLKSGSFNEYIEGGGDNDKVMSWRSGQKKRLFSKDVHRRSIFSRARCRTPRLLVPVS